ncbi:MAG: molybdopterin molybdotransferase MoeA [Pseudomonadota bacterium]|nr:molybdopterin molybdotransferase MoeA [Pseudomonadota bacterium]
MISFDEAIALLSDAARPLGQERLPIAEAAGRILAEPVISAVSSPPRDCSSMDGYAVRDADLAVLPARLALAGESFPGRGFGGPVEPGRCVRIFTGAPVPAGADRVLIQEEVRREGELAIFETVPGEARHIRPGGSDFAKGETLVPAGRRLGPRALVAAGAADMAELRLWRRPRVAIVTTGDELVEPGEARTGAEMIPESVSLGVAAQAGQWGATVIHRARLADQLDKLQEAAAELLSSADLVVVTGGASVGERDFAKAMFAPFDLELIFSKVAIKPGKPVWFGRAGGTLLLGLPGNPTSAMVTARLFLAPLLAGLEGGEAAGALRWRRGRLVAGVGPCEARETFVRAALEKEGVRPLTNQDSGAQKTLVDADLLIRRRPHSPSVPAGEEVEIIDF